jgi:hypothetical protein
VHRRSPVPHPEARRRARLRAAQQPAELLEDDVCERAEAEWVAARADRLLPRRQAEALRLTAAGGDVQQVAGQLDSGYRTAESLLARARRTLRSVLVSGLGLLAWMSRATTGAAHNPGPVALATAATVAVAGPVALLPLGESSLPQSPSASAWVSPQPARLSADPAPPPTKAPPPDPIAVLPTTPAPAAGATSEPDPVRPEPGPDPARSTRTPAPVPAPVAELPEPQAPDSVPVPTHAGPAAPPDPVPVPPAPLPPEVPADEPVTVVDPVEPEALTDPQRGPVDTSVLDEPVDPPTTGKKITERKRRTIRSEAYSSMPAR